MGLVAVQPNRWTWWETAGLAVYCGVLSFAIAHHVPWADEAQAWLIARDMSWWQMVAHGVRYEGSPALWHSLLLVLNRLHFSYAGMHWFTGLFGVSSTLVLYRWAPFPRYLRLLLPFTFFLLYQDTVVARSYALFAVLAFAACALIRSQRQRPLLLALVLGLMANTSAHAFITAAGFVLTAAWMLWRSRRPPEGVRTGTAPAPGMRAWAPAAVLYCAFALAAALSAAPPQDASFTAGTNTSNSVTRIERTLHLTNRPLIPRQEPTPAGQLAPDKPLVHHRTMASSLHLKIERLLSIITFPLSSFRYFGLLVCLLLALYAFDRPQPPLEPGRAGLAPYGLVVLVFLSMYLAPRHFGTFLTAFLASAWLCWTIEPQTSWRMWRQRTFSIALLLLCLEQIGWTAHAMYGDLHGAYAGDLATAEFLKEHAQGKKVDGFYYHSIGPLAWFDHNIFADQPHHGYWLWSKNLRISERAPYFLSQHPDYLVIGGWQFSPENGEVALDWMKPEDPLNPVPFNDSLHIIPYAEQHGYRVTHRFCGKAWMRFGYSEELCQTIMEPDQPGANTSIAQKR